MQFSDFTKGKKIYQNGYEARKPLISVVMPTFCRNKEGLLRPCIESVLRQTLQNFEFIVIDDGSSDGTESVLEEYAIKDSRIVYIRHDTNSGLPAVRTNEGILESRSQYISFMFDDNIWQPNTLEVLFSEMQKRKCDMVFSNTRIYTSKNDSFPLGEFPLCREFLSHINTIPNGSVLCSMDFFNKFGLYDMHLSVRRLCDWDLWLRALAMGATFSHVNMELSKEFGPSSPASLGTSVPWDYKVTYAYMTDADFRRVRSERLKPASIDNFDVFDTNLILNFLRNKSEWEYHEEIVYKPFFQKRDYYGYEPPTISNRQFEAGMACSLLGQKKRILLVSNIYTPLLDYWKKCISKNFEAIVVTCGAWQVSLYRPQDLDLMIVFDVAEQSIGSILKSYRIFGVPVIYVGFFGPGVCSSPASNDSDIDFGTISAIKNIFNSEMYFPSSKATWNDEQKENAIAVAKMCSIAILPFQIEDNSTALSCLKLDDYFNEMLITRVSQLQMSLRSVNFQKGNSGFFLNSEMLSGSEAYAIQIASLYQNMGQKIRIFIPSKSDTEVCFKLAQTLKEKGLPEPIPAPYSPFNLIPKKKDIKKLTKWLEQHGITNIFCGGFMPEILEATKTLGLPTFISLFQPSGYHLPSVISYRDHFQGCITDSTWSHGTWQKILGSPTSVVRTYVDFAFTTRSTPQSGTIKIAIGGTVQPRKRQLEAVKIVHSLIAAGFDLHLNIYGYHLESLDEYVKSITDYIQDKGIEDKIRFHGLTDLDSIAENNHIIFSMSLDESLPQTTLYLMAKGLIAIACPAGGLDELIIDKKTGFISTGFSISETREALSRAISNIDFWPEISHNAHAHIQKYYSAVSAEDALAGLLDLGLQIFRQSEHISSNQRAKFFQIICRRFMIPYYALRYLKQHGLRQFTRRFLSRIGVA